MFCGARSSKTSTPLVSESHHHWEFSIEFERSLKNEYNFYKAAFLPNFYGTKFLQCIESVNKWWSLRTVSNTLAFLNEYFWFVRKRSIHNSVPLKQVVVIKLMRNQSVFEGRHFRKLVKFSRFREDLFSRLGQYKKISLRELRKKKKIFLDFLALVRSKQYNVLN